MRNTIRNVTIVVPVLIVSCQVSLKRKMGPQMSQSSTAPDAKMKADGLPAAREVTFAKWVNQLLDFTGRMIASRFRGTARVKKCLGELICRPG
jgi:hypothetical protein